MCLFIVQGIELLLGALLAPGIPFVSDCAALFCRTGEHGVGGRLATRAEADGSLPGAPAGVAGLVFDHAAQYFTASDPAFQGMVERWEAGGEGWGSQPAAGQQRGWQRGRRASFMIITR